MTDRGRGCGGDNDLQGRIDYRCDLELLGIVCSCGGACGGAWQVCG